MLAIFGSGAAEGGGLANNPLLMIICVIVLAYIFLKVCGLGKKCKISGGIKKIIFVLTGLGLIFFNALYIMGNKQIETTGSWSIATYAVIGSLIWVFIFGFFVSADTKK